MVAGSLTVKNINTVGGIDTIFLGSTKTGNIDATPAFGIFVFIHGINAAEDGAGFGIGQIDRAQRWRNWKRPGRTRSRKPTST